MKATTLTKNVAACAGHALLYCYRIYMLVNKNRTVYEETETLPVNRHIRFTSNQFESPCYN